MNQYPNGPQQPYGQPQYPYGQGQPQYPQQPPRELIRARCRQGEIVVTENAIRVESGTLKQQTILRNSITGIDYKQALPSLFGRGGAVSLTFHGQGAERLHVDLIRPKIAKEIMLILGY